MGYGGADSGGVWRRRQKPERALVARPGSGNYSWGLLKGQPRLRFGPRPGSMGGYGAMTQTLRSGPWLSTARTGRTRAWHWPGHVLQSPVAGGPTQPRKRMHALRTGRGHGTSWSFTTVLRVRPAPELEAGAHKARPAGANPPARNPRAGPGHASPAGRRPMPLPECLGSKAMGFHEARSPCATHGPATPAGRPAAHATTRVLGFGLKSHGFP